MQQVKNDFRALFQPPKLAPIDGLRSISCIMIIAIHVITLLNSFIAPYPHEKWMAYLKSYSFQLGPLLSLSLETFFMLSGFLLTYKFIEQGYVFSWKSYPLYVLRRACRFWPGILFATVIMLGLGEPDGNWTSLWLFYQNYVDLDQWTGGFAALWSISVDMQVHILLPIILYAIMRSKSTDQRTYSALYALVILSVVYSLFAFDPETMDLPTLISRYNSLSLLMPQRLFDWMKNEYNVTVIVQRPPAPISFKLYLEKMYFPLVSRYCSFIIGSILAFKLFNVQRRAFSHYSYMKKYTFFTVTSLFIFILTIPPDTDINRTVLTVMISIIRPLFSISQAFVLFSVLCPSSHPYHSPWAKAFLSLSVWTPIAKLSYLVYVSHFRIILELLLTQTHLFDPNRFSIDILTVVCVAMVLMICLLLSLPWYLLVEKPIERFVNKLLPNQGKTRTD